MKVNEMKNVSTVILCGGRGTRMRELARTIPKPMVPIGDRPLLWHIMEWYARFDCTDFVLALGWRGEAIKSFVLHHRLLLGDFAGETGTGGEFAPLNSADPALEPWRISCIDTGRDSKTATRVKRVADRTSGDQIMVTYGDGLSDIDIDSLLRFHRDHGRLATISAVRPPGQYGEVALSRDGRVEVFREKPAVTDRRVNGGFMVFEREAIDRYFPEDRDVMLEEGPLNALARDGELMGYQHDGFWRAMDDPNDHAVLDQMWNAGKAPWRVG